MKKSPLIAGALLGVSVLGLGIAVAQEGPGGMGRGEGHRPHAPRLAEVDTNEDGNISLEEIQANETSRFADIDANGDGQVSAEEVLGFEEARREAERR